MKAFRTEDGRYLLVEQDDKNAVVYDRGVAVWDRWSHEHGEAPAALPAAPPSPFPIVGVPPAPLPNPSGVPSQILQVTQPSDGWIPRRMYSYWANAWRQGDVVWVFCGHQDGRPRFFRVTLASGAVERRDWLLRYGGETEGWFWDARGWITLCAGPRLLRANPFTGELEILLDISGSRPGYDLWQAHSSADGTIHSATVRRVGDGPYVKVGTLLQVEGQQTFYPAMGVLDESALAASHLIIKEDDDNFIVPIRAPQDAWSIRDRDRALGHSDCGDGWMIGEADKPDPGGCGWWDLYTKEFHFLFPTLNMGYLAVRGEVILHSTDTQISLLNRHTGLETPLVEYPSVWHPDRETYYNQRPKANLSPCGTVGCYMLNGIVYLLEVP